MNFLLRPTDELGDVSSLDEGRVIAPDHYESLRVSRRKHRENAHWYARRARNLDGSINKFFAQWFMAEVRTHRLYSRALWKAGTN